MKQVIFSLIEAKCHDQQFDVNHLINDLRISNAYLWELCLEYFGFPPRELIESVRLENVINYIGSNEHSIVIKKECGFGSLRTFERAFMKRIGITYSDAHRRFMDSKDKEGLKIKWRDTLWQGKAPSIVISNSKE